MANTSWFTKPPTWSSRICADISSSRITSTFCSPTPGEVRLNLWGK
jgi:hypothetical protein